MRWVVVFLLSGCSSILGIDDFKVAADGQMGDDGGETGYCLGQTGWRVCTAIEPMNVATPIADLAFSTGATGGGTPMPSALCSTTQLWASAGQPEACFITAKQITIGSNVTVTGQRPLVIFASDSITITGQLDVASHTPVAQPTVGPGSPSSRCLVPTAPVSTGSIGGGGAGASFMDKGGDGGSGTGTAIRGVAAAADSMSPVILRGGCNGGKGADAGSELGGSGGSGGGAVYLVAMNRITINGYINASGGAGKGGGRSAGGGGGGTGGMIVLVAPTITGNGGVLVANGAGGGGGGGGNQFGSPGNDPVPQMPSMIPTGGMSPVSSIGGNGTAGMMTATSGSAPAAGATGGGGGGGGAKGYIRTSSALGQITTSPTPTLVP